MYLGVCVLYILFVLRIAFRRFEANPSGSLLNPLFYLVVLSAFYFILPLTISHFTLSIIGWNIHSETILKCTFISFYYCVVFLGFYLSSKDHAVQFAGGATKKEGILLAKILNALICILLLYIIVARVPSVFAVRGSRVAAYSLYQHSIESPFKLRIIMLVHFGILWLLFIRYRKYKWLLPLLAYLIIDFSHGGRIASVMTCLFFYIILVIDKKKTFLRWAIAAVILFLAAGVLQRDTVAASIVWKLYSASLEFVNTYLTTIFLCEHPEYHQGALEYIIWSISKILPGGLVGRVMEFEGWYGELLSDRIGLGYGLAGNIISEALIYGGWLGGIINPFLIGGICLFVNSMKGKKTLAGSWSVLFLCLPMQENMRQFFWGYCFYPIQLVFFWGIWACSNWNAVVLETAKPLSTKQILLKKRKRKRHKPFAIYDV